MKHLQQSEKIVCKVVTKVNECRDFTESFTIDFGTFKAFSAIMSLKWANTKIDIKKLTTKPTCVIIGPEGDFSEEEREKILKFNGVQPIKINENILRSETAVISALSIINYAIN